MSEFIKYNLPDDLRVLQDETLKKISKAGKIKIGINEVTKAIERGNAKFVVIAEDVSPVEIVMHIPVISKEKKIVFSYSKTKEDLGKSVGISAKASCIAVIDAGSLQKELTTLMDKIEDVSGGKKTSVKKEEVKKEEPKKEEVKKEEPKKEEVKKEEPKKEEVKKEEVKKEEVKKEEPKKEEVKKEEVKKEEPKKEENKE
jgi:large subunit ribosomal protein L7Ae